MAVAINVGMQGRRRNKYDLWRLHGVMLREIDLELVTLISIQRTLCANDLDHPPLEIVGDFVLEAQGRVDLPFNQLLL